MDRPVWVVESFYANKWGMDEMFRTRREARQYQQRYYAPGVSRIRKYVPA